MKLSIQVVLSDPRTYWSCTESSEVATENFAALQDFPTVPLQAFKVAMGYTIAIEECPAAPLEASGVAAEYTIAIQESPGVPLETSEVPIEYTITIQGSSRAASRLPREQDSVLRLHLLVPVDI
ncbi:hypothetical protein BDD12DRAFT_884229 [Trichophaea hybrida]|nr:hypothetical protein BDD12DRAFT_884229 [Trichophaea hybrida]